MHNGNLTYISLFSSAGVGCYGFKVENFDCIATNELIQRRIDVQKYNKKCKYESGYICGDITQSEVKDKLYAQIELWRNNHKVRQVDVIIATPPCQGMSVANHKKSDTEIKRNSLVVESINLIKEIKPKFFVFENVPAFMKTVCTDLDGVAKPIAEAIQKNLGDHYSYIAKTINFKDYGASSSRQRTLVIGVSTEMADNISPFELFPLQQKEKTLREVIGTFPPLCNMGESAPQDVYHYFRPYPQEMRQWIQDLKEGENAFQHADDRKKPHQVKDGVIVVNQQKNGDKYRRQIWDKVGPCVHTRNDQLASQNTIHPVDDRVFSIRELMAMMTVPDSFRWVEQDLSKLNGMTLSERKKFFKKEEIKIRQSLGEAVPTTIFQEIARNIKESFTLISLKTAEINKIVSENDFGDIDKLLAFIDNNPLNLSYATLSKIAELSNTARTDNGAFFTDKSLITEILKKIPVCEKEEVRILEPSVGVGNFIPLILERFQQKKIIIDVVDIDESSLMVFNSLLKKLRSPKKVTINTINSDFLLHNFTKRYDYIIGNPPFFKIKTSNQLLASYREKAINKKTSNISSFFLDKAMALSDYVALIMPKFVMNTPEFEDTRSYLQNKSVAHIIDFGEKVFSGVLVETIALLVDTKSPPSDTEVTSFTRNTTIKQKQSYVSDPQYPYWILYRNKHFDAVAEKLEFGVFSVFRDRQITKKLLTSDGEIRVLKSRNINDTGTEIIDISGYDSYISEKLLRKMAVGSYLNKKNVYLTPNMTYNPRVIKKPKGCVVNGSLGILIPKDGQILSESQLLYFSSKEFRDFYKIARNFQTRSLNVDSCSVYFYGLLK